MPLLEASNISKSYAGVRALRSVSFDLLPGEVHALVGENGAGKSTLIKVVTEGGRRARFRRRCTSSASVVEHHNPTQAHSLGIAVVYQQPALFPDLTVAENIALALESGGPWRRIDWKARARAAREALANAPAPASTPPRASPRSACRSSKSSKSSPRPSAHNEESSSSTSPPASLTDREAERLFRVIATVRGEVRSVASSISRTAWKNSKPSAIESPSCATDETIATCDMAKGRSSRQAQSA